MGNSLKIARAFKRVQFEKKKDFNYYAQCKSLINLITQTITHLLYDRDKHKSVQVNLHCSENYRTYSIKRRGRLFNFWTFRVGAYSRWALI